MRVSFYTLVLVAFFSCSNKLQVEGTYINTEHPYREILFSKKEFVFRYIQDTNIPYYCTDTIAYGNWVKFNGHPFLKLNSESLQYESLIGLNVHEEKKSDGQEISFFVQSPIERHYKDYNAGNVRPIYYSIDLRSSCLDFQDSIARRKFTSNKFTLQLPNGCDLTSFSLVIYASNTYRDWEEERPPNVINTLKYEIKDFSSNHFKIDIPNLTYCYMNALRLKEDFVLIKSSNHLEWNGESYKKK